MKAPPMFDNLMFRIAKYASAILAGIFALPLFLIVFSTLIILPLNLLEYIMVGPTHHMSPELQTVLDEPSLKDPKYLLYLSCSLILFASVRMLPGLPARICLAATSIIPTAMLIPCLPFVAFAIFAASHSYATTFAMFLVYMIGFFSFVGFFSMLWVAIRPPSSGRSSPNPVNLVNPV